MLTQGYSVNGPLILGTCTKLCEQKYEETWLHSGARYRDGSKTQTHTHILTGCLAVLIIVACCFCELIRPQF